MKEATRIYYKEEQCLRHSPAIWILYTVFLMYILISAWSLYQQLVLKPSGGHPSMDAQLLISMGAGMLILLAIIIFMSRVKLVTVIYPSGIRINFQHIVSKERFISKAEISRFEIRKYKPVLEYGGWGMRSQRPHLIRARRFGTAYNISGNIGLQLYLRNGPKILIGTQNPTGMERAMKKLMKEEGGVVDG
ncbi:MAG: hypothetical protein JXR71_09655 [Bacteroidales bacterium]|nr:hypothetical protein [Bacteroidales bacterium]